MNNISQQQVPFNLYRYQRRMMPVLLGWAAGSMVVGGFWWFSKNRLLKGVGGQFFAWGLIDGLIALFGLRSAASNRAKFDQGELDATDLDRQTQTFERILWVNVVLDVGYVWFGRRMQRQAGSSDLKRGTGLGIMIQGAFLFVWDLMLIFLMRSVGRRH